jgi:HSP20 family protein
MKNEAKEVLMTNETQSIDGAIEQVERLYESVTGREAPTLEDKPYATIPPEKVPEEHVQEQVDRLIQTLAHFSGKPETEPEWKPAIALWEGRNEVRIVVDLPGVERDEVRVAVSRGMLELTGIRVLRPTEDDSLKLRYAEHPYGKFRRTMPLPHGAKVEQLKAEMKGGVLELRIPREAEIVEIKTVTVG